MLKLFSSKSKVAKVRILVIDDEPDLVSTIQYRLECANCQVVTAANGKEGLEKASEEKPDLILLDTNMPVMNGYEVLERLKDYPELKDVPVIMVTVMCEPQHIATASAYGVADYVTKPIDSAELMEKIANVLKNKVNLTD
jgi:two-component system alkaline phosphatase synthesis response regulator PhoP